MIDLLLIAGGIGLGSLLLYGIVNLLIIGDLEGAIERTIEGAGSFILGIFSAGLIVAVEIGAIVAQFGDLIGSVAGTFSAGIVTLLGIGSLSGVIELGPELFALVSVIAIVGAHALGDG
jgi:hypothetical protein